MTSSETTDLFVLTADSQVERTIETLLTHRRPSLNIRDVSFEVQRHPRSDPGCRIASAEFLRHLRGKYDKAIVIFDYEGCGAIDVTAQELEDQLERELHTTGWEPDSVSVIVIGPELEVCMLGAAFQHLQRRVNWTGPQNLRNWLIINGYLTGEQIKPENPKQAIQHLLDLARRPRSTKLYEDIAMQVSLARCQDRAFQKFRNTLQRWFPVQ